MVDFAGRNQNSSARPASSYAGTGKPAFNMRERLDPELFNFGNGDVLTGILTAIRHGMVKGKQAARYMIEDLESKKAFFFWGTHQLNEKLRPGDVGHVVEIRCEGELPNARRGENAMKVFKVLVSDDTAPGWANDGTPITDDDVFA